MALGHDKATLAICEKAAEQGLPTAQLAMAQILYFLPGVAQLRLSCDQGFQGNAVGDQSVEPFCWIRRCFLKSAKSRPTVSRDMPIICPISFVSRSQLQLAGVSGFGVLVKPSHQQSSQLFAGGVRKYQVTDFPTSAGVVVADVLGHPQDKLAVKAHEAQQIALSQEGDFARLLGFGGRFILTSGNHSGNSQWATGLNNSQNQRPAVTATNGELHPASTHDEYSPRSLPFVRTRPLRLDRWW